MKAAMKGVRIAKVLFLTAVIMGLLFHAGLWGIYLYGAQALPENTAPADQQIPQGVSRVVWSSEIGGSNPMTMVPLSPWNWVIAFASVGTPGTEQFPPSGRAASLAARVLLARNREPQRALEWQAAWAAATIWVSRNWTAEEATATILSESYFGHGLHGITQAAQGYFGLPVEELALAEAGLLAGLLKSPHRYDPWCRPERAHAFAQERIKLLSPDAEYSPRLRRAPAGTTC